MADYVTGCTAARKRNVLSAILKRDCVSSKKRQQKFGKTRNSIICECTAIFLATRREVIVGFDGREKQKGGNESCSRGGYACESEEVAS